MNEPLGLAAKLKNIDGKYVPSSGILKKANVVSSACKANLLVEKARVGKVDTVGAVNVDTSEVAMAGGHTAKGNNTSEVAEVQTTEVDTSESDTARFGNLDTAGLNKFDTTKVMGTGGVGRVDTTKMSYAVASSISVKTSEVEEKRINLRYMINEEKKEGFDVVLPRESVREVCNKMEFTLYGYFLGNRVAFPAVDYFVSTNWKKLGIQKSMMNSNGFFFFKFADKKGMMDVIEAGPWMIRNKPIILNVWSPSTNLQKEDIKSVAVWVKLHDVPLVAYTDVGLSLLVSQIGTPKMLDSVTIKICVQIPGAGVALLER